MTILHQLSASCQTFIDVANRLSEEQFHNRRDTKWSVADVMQHLYLSARPVARLMSGPREVLNQWGTANWPARTYTELASAYATVLGTGVKAPVAMVPRMEDMQVEKRVLVERFAGIYQTLLDVSKTWSERELTTYCIPHPVLGMLTVQEMLFFTDIHTQHHLRLLPET